MGLLRTGDGHAASTGLLGKDDEVVVVVAGDVVMMVTLVVGDRVMVVVMMVGVDDKLVVVAVVKVVFQFGSVEARPLLETGGL